MLHEQDVMYENHVTYGAFRHLGEIAPSQRTVRNIIPVSLKMVIYGIYGIYAAERRRARIWFRVP